MAEKDRRLRLTGTLFLEGVSLTLLLGALPSEQIEPRKVKLDLTWTGEVFAEGHPVVDYSNVCTALKDKLNSSYRNYM